MVLPNFFVVGGYRCGTTNLCNRLAQSPQVFMCPVKEPNFFNDRPTGGIPYPDWDAYEALFNGVTSEIAVGEGTTRYSHRDMCPEVASRIAKHLPYARIIYNVRHPATVLPSMWMHRRRWEEAPILFTDFVRSEATLARIRYMYQISSYRDHFPDERIRVTFFEDQVQRPNEHLAHCLTFLGAAQTPVIDDGGKNTGKEWTVARPWALSLSRQPMIRRVTSLLPTGLKQIYRWAVYEHTIQPPQWSRDDLTRTLDALGDEMDQILDYAGKPRSFWSRNVEQLLECSRPSARERRPVNPPTSSKVG